MYSKDQFSGDFIKAYGHLGTSVVLAGKLAPTSQLYVDACFRVYENAARNPLSALVVGRLVKKDGEGARINLEQIVTGLDDIERENFGVTNDSSGGSVLSSDAWSIPMNDAWVLGGVHANLDFYLASPRTETNVIDPQFGATVTGRELLGLTTFGYTLHPNDRLGEVYVCTDKPKARTASFVAYDAAFVTAKKGNGFQALIK